MFDWIVARDTYILLTHQGLEGMQNVIAAPCRDWVKIFLFCKMIGYFLLLGLQKILGLQKAGSWSIDNDIEAINDQRPRIK